MIGRTAAALVAASLALAGCAALNEFAERALWGLSAVREVAAAATASEATPGEQARAAIAALQERGVEVVDLSPEARRYVEGLCWVAALVPTAADDAGEALCAAIRQADEEG